MNSAIIYETFNDGAKAIDTAYRFPGMVSHWTESGRAYGYMEFRWYFCTYRNGERYSICILISESTIKSKKDTPGQRRRYKGMCAAELRRIAEKYDGGKIENEYGESLRIMQYDDFIRMPVTT